MEYSTATIAKHMMAPAEARTPLYDPSILTVSRLCAHSKCAEPTHAVLEDIRWNKCRRDCAEEGACTDK
jgi:hypothetical protein